LAGFYPGLFAERPINILDITPELTGEWITTRVEHTLGATLTSLISAERDNEKET